MRAFGFAWGIAGVLAMLSFAVYRLAPIAFELRGLQLSLLQSAALVFSVAYMSYAEGYKGFYKGFSPRLIQRAVFLRNNPRWLHVLLAPAFCMGYFYATRRRKILSIGLTVVVMGFVVVARQLPQPWRGILDAGVVAGLSVGIASILYFLVQSLRDSDFIQVSPEVPEARGQQTSDGKGAQVAVDA